METVKRRVGRPKTAPQNGPLVLSEDRARTAIEVEVNATIAAELRAYARWVELSAGLSTADAMAVTIEFAARELFRRDRLWQERRRKGDGEEGPRRGVSAPMRTQPSSPPISTPSSPSLPPPSPRTASAATTRPPGERPSHAQPQPEKST